MDNVDKLRGELQLPAINHIGIVVKDINNTINQYSLIYGLGPFTVYEFKPDKHWFMGESSFLRLMIAKAMWGNIEMEFIQHLEGKADHKTFADTHGEGLHHLGFLVPNYDDMFNRFTNAGFLPLMQAETYLEAYKGDLKACYFDTRRASGVIIEIVWRSWVKQS